MGSIIARFLESVLLLVTGRTLTITFWIIVISHSASPLTASLLLRSGSIPRGSSSFSTTISLQTNASKKTTFFVLGSYQVQKSHGTQTPSSIHSCVNCSSLRSAFLHMMPSKRLFTLHTYSGLQNPCNVWEFQIGGNVVPEGVGMALSAGGVKWSTSSWLQNGL